MHRSNSILLQASLVLATLTAVAPVWAQQSCPSIRAAEGKCADPALVAAANRRATIISSAFASYLGTPQGTVGLSFIPHERLFRDDPVVFGLPTNIVDIGDSTRTIRSK